MSPSQLIVLDEKYKIHNKIRIAYQVPDIAGDATARSFEDAFILSNSTLFDDMQNIAYADRELQAWEIAQEQDKTDFAIKYSVEITNWETPLYIREGLEWLASEFCAPSQLSEAQVPGIESEFTETNVAEVEID